MKIIHKYIFLEVFKWFLFSVLVLTSILFLVKSLVLVELVMTRGLSFIGGIQLVIYILPTFLSVTVPPSLFIGSLVAFADFSADNEYTAMKTSGWGFLFLIKPVILIAIFTLFLTSSLIFYLLPIGNHSLKVFLFEILQKKVNIKMKPRVFSREFPGYVLFFKNIEKDGRLMDIFVSSNLSGESAKTILAEEGILVPNPDTLKIHLQMKKGIIHEIGASGKNYSTTYFESFELLIAFPNMEKLISKMIHGGVVVNETSLGELWERITKGAQAGHNLNWDKVVLSRKFSIPFSCLLFGLAGVPLGIGNVRSGKYGNYLKGLITIGIYYFFMMATQKMGASGVINPYLSVWIPNALLAIFTFHIIRQAQQDRGDSFIEHSIRFMIGYGSAFFRRMS